jgi:two-component system response regulator FixJ
MSAPTNKLIAIIDNDFLVRRYLERLLSASGYATDSFATADEFLADAETCKAACLVLDFELKDSSGCELARHPTLRALQCPIVLISSNLNDDLQRQALELSGASVLCKPFKAIEILPRIANAIRAR